MLVKELVANLLKQDQDAEIVANNGKDSPLTVGRVAKARVTSDFCWAYENEPKARPVAVLYVF